MTDIKKLTVGTRGSKLALVQAELVVKALQDMHLELIVETRVITTKGDVNQAPIPLDVVGKAWFTEEIEQALLAEEIDIAVHSLKDLPPELPSGLMVVPVLARADAADVLVSKSGAVLKDLKQGAVIGTDSARRKALILGVRSDARVMSIRGNVDTRLKKLETQEYDAIVIAAAGLDRLGLGDRITERFDPTVFIPAPGQAILAVEAKESRTELQELLRSIIDVPTAAAAAIERAFSVAIGGGCKLPIGCYAEITGEQVTIHACVGNITGDHIVRKSKVGFLSEGIVLAQELAKEF